MVESQRLAGKVIVIIGGTSGLGLAAVKACLAEGARVVLTGKDDPAAAVAHQTLGDTVQILASDATEPDSAQQAIDTALEVYGGFDALYHVAGGSGRQWGDGPLHEVTDQGWDKTLQLNLSSVFYSNRAAVRNFLNRNVAGCVVNMASVLGFSPSPVYFSTHSYAASKAAIIGMTTSAASYYAHRNIRLNALAPAVVETPMAHRAAADPEIRQFVQTKQPLDGGRLGVPDDLNGAAIFLLSDESRFVTGQVLVVDGGWSISEGQIPKPGTA